MFLYEGEEEVVTFISHFLEGFYFFFAQVDTFPLGCVQPAGYILFVVYIYYIYNIY